jgi:hypothetical protein
MSKRVLFILTIFIILSGCVEESKVNHSNKSVHQGQANITPENLSSINLSKEENIPEVKVRSFSSIHMHDNSETGYNIAEKYYAVYDLTIKNNGSNNLNFKLNKLHVRDGDYIFNTTILNINDFSGRSRVDVLSNLETETKLGDTTLFPRQTINGSVVFQVNSLYNKSFLLKYNETPITSASFEKSIEALSTAERYNYSVIFGVPPYRSDGDTIEPNLEMYPFIYSNWINRSIFEFFDKVDSEDVLKSSPNDIHKSIIVYALKVIPERNITIRPVKNPQNNLLIVDGNGVKYLSKVPGNPQNNLLIVDDNGEELVNTSLDKIAILKNQTYVNSEEIMDIPQMNFSNVTIVRTSFGRFGEFDVSIYCYNNQDVILDCYLNIILVRHNDFGAHAP